MIKINTNNFDWDEINKIYANIVKNVFNAINRLGSIEKDFILKKLLNCDAATYKKTCVETYLMSKNLNHIVIPKSCYYYEVVEKVFSYAKLEGEPRHKLLTAMNIRVCPYCNRQYITTYEDHDGGASKSKLVKKTTASLDHFYPQAKYPHLALSLYNLIPSCHICNSVFKLDKSNELDGILYPYSNEFGNDAKFVVANTNLDYLMTNDAIKIDISRKSTEKQIEKSIKQFHIIQVYQSHADYVKELITKYQIYNGSQIYEFFFNYRNMFSSEVEIKRLIFGNYTMFEDLDKRPLAKLTKDILEELNACKRQ